jgi:hypothetical protein
MNHNRSAAGSKPGCSVRLFTAPVFVLLSHLVSGYAQTVQPVNLNERVRQLSAAVDRVQVQVEESQRELADLKSQLAALQGAASLSLPSATEPPPASDAAELSAAVSGIRDAQSIHETQIATLQQTKIESDSKYPLKLSGLILMTGIISTQGVDSAQTPAVALHGSGSTAATIRQSILGLDARGPHLLGATSHADLRLDFDAGSGVADYSANSALGLLRMRTAHAELNWKDSSVFFSLDRPLMSPEAPASLTAVALPALAWSGALWRWNPQVGGTHDFFSAGALGLRAQAAFIDVADLPPPDAAAATYFGPSTTEQSRWPGMQARIALVNAGNEGGMHFGIGGYVAPHRLAQGKRFNSWAGTADFNLPITRFGQITASAYTGQALGGLGEGAFKDYVMRTYYGEKYFRALDDMGGWLQWKQRSGTRLEFNEAFGADNVPAHQLRPFTITNYDSYYNLARNRTVTGNVIYSPSAYLLFSLEYRRIASSFVNSPTEFSDIIGVGAGYKF